MSRWDNLTNQAERIQRDLEFTRHQITGTTYSQMLNYADKLETLLNNIEVDSVALVKVAESLDQSTGTVAIHRQKGDD